MVTSVKTIEDMSLNVQESGDWEFHISQLEGKSNTLDTTMTKKVDFFCLVSVNEFKIF
jgi:hypothetical protein